MGLAVLLVAVLAAAFAVGFRLSLAFVMREVANAGDVVTAMREAPLWARLGFPALGGLLAGGIGLLVQRARGGGGVSNVMEAVVLGGVHLSMRVTLLKSAGAWLAIASGGSLGREGPL